MNRPAARPGGGFFFTRSALPEKGNSALNMGPGLVYNKAPGGAAGKTPRASRRAHVHRE